MDVSVIIPVFNGAATIASAIESALAQKFDGDFEIVVVNDGSTDGTAKVLASYGDRIKVVPQENRGLAAARNTGARNSPGKYLAWLDADDEWHADKLSRTVSVLESDQGCGLAYSDAALAVSQGTPPNHSYVPTSYSREPTLDDLLREWWYILPSTVVMRRSIFDICGGFSEEFGRRGFGGEDVLMWIQARARAHFRFVPEQLVRYLVSDPLVHLAKRIPESSGWANDRRQNIRARLLVEGEDIFIRLVGREYGHRAWRVAQFYRSRQVGLLIAAGMLAMSQGNPHFARDCYLQAFKRQPLQLKLPFRLAWTFVPDPLRRPIAAILPSRVARALCGPPTM